MTVTLPDGSRLELPEGATGHDAAAAIGPGPAPAPAAVRRAAGWVCVDARRRFRGVECDREVTVLSPLQD